MCAAKESRRVWKALNLWRLLQFMKNCSTSRWLILVMLHRNCVCFAFRAAAFGVGDLNIGSTTASLSRSPNGTNIDARRLVNIDDDHWDCVRLSVTGLVGLLRWRLCTALSYASGLPRLCQFVSDLRIDPSCVDAPLWLAVGNIVTAKSALAGASREAQAGHRMLSSTMYLHGPFMARFTSWRTTHVFLNACQVIHHLLLNRC